MDFDPPLKKWSNLTCCDTGDFEGKVIEYTRIESHDPQIEADDKHSSL